MSSGSKYYECVGTPKNEDFDCSDSLSYELSKYDTYIFDHRHYFDHKVPSFGKLGCVANKTLEEKIPNNAESVSASGNTEEPVVKKKTSFASLSRSIGDFFG